MTQRMSMFGRMAAACMLTAGAALSTAPAVSANSSAGATPAVTQTATTALPYCKYGPKHSGSYWKWDTKGRDHWDHKVKNYGQWKWHHTKDYQYCAPHPRCKYGPLHSGWNWKWDTKGKDHWDYKVKNHGKWYWKHTKENQHCASR